MAFAMISVTRLKGQVVALNPDLIELVEETPDTTVRLTSGDKILVRESLQEIIELVVRYRRSLVSAFASGAEVLTHARPGAEAAGR